MSERVRGVTLCTRDRICEVVQEFVSECHGVV